MENGLAFAGALRTLGAALEEVEYVEGLAARPARKPALQSFLPVLVVDLALFLVGEDLVGVGQLLELLLGNLRKDSPFLGRRPCPDAP